MPFQFTCPQGHLLSAHESQSGQQCQCPHCGQWLIIPGTPPPPPTSLPADLLSELPAPAPPPPGMPGSPTYGLGNAAIGGMVQPHISHIPCPNGHPLETPIDMLGTRVMCPICQAQFDLRYEDSLEFKEQQERLEEARIARSGQLWLRWAIGFAVVVLLGLAAMIYALNKPK